MPSFCTNLLIVDDEPSTRISLTHIFTGLGYKVHSAEDGFSALLAIRQEVPDIILSDLNMPGMSGFEFLSVVRRRFPAIRAIAMSGAFSGEGVQPGVAADAFYEKGANLSVLLNAVESIAQDRRAIRDHELALPIWIPRNGNDSSGEAFVMISCPECLRAFRQVHGETIRVVQETGCSFCRSVIHYAIVESTNPASPQTFQRKPAPIGPATFSGSLPESRAM